MQHRSTEETDLDLDTWIDTEGLTPMPGSAASRQGDPIRIGPYQILGRLGSGGMGTVFLAEQREPVQRKVAIKVMRASFSEPEARIRFETERQAMARLQHPNVAQILTADTTPGGRPYFVMEHVEGDQIVRYCDEKRLTLEERLTLFCDVCSGVQHAHQKGIIHRDLKPSNILVTEIEGRPVPKIIDFGIAKALDQPLSQEAAVTGDRLIGTPAYLSPEAARMDGGKLDVDTRSDVFSLGILLYELLVGRRPYEEKGSDLIQLLQRMAVEEPTGPSRRLSGLDLSEREVVAHHRDLDATSLRRVLRGELDWIVLKAIARDRDRRYDSAADLAKDLHRYLHHEPVTAGPPSALYRTQKFVRRRLGLVIAALVTVVALLAGFAARTLEAERANREAAAAIEARREMAEALVKAEEAEAAAGEVSRFLVGLFSVSDPGTARGSTVTARELLDAGSEKIRESLDDQPLAKARLMQTMADVYRKLGLYDNAEGLFKEALQIRRVHLDPADLAVAESLNGLAALHAELGRLQEALPLFEETLKIRKLALGENDLMVAHAMTNLGNLLSDLKQFDRAEALYRGAVEIVEAYDGPPTQNQMISLNNLATLYLDQERNEEAIPLLRRFIEFQQKHHGADHPWVAHGQKNLGVALGRLGDRQAAETALEESLRVFRQVYGEEHPMVGACLAVQASLWVDFGRLGEAEVLYDRVRGIYEAASLPKDHPFRASLAEGREKLATELAKLPPAPPSPEPRGEGSVGQATGSPVGGSLLVGGPGAPWSVWGPSRASFRV